MLIKTARFIISNVDVKKCPSAVYPEYAFVGRSNVGKSSLINMLTNNKSLAKISSKPGKTKLINHFLINNNWYLVDLPGYGYAKISKKERTLIGKIIKQYIEKRENLTCLFLLIDSRLKPQQNDMEFIEWLGINKVPIALVFTKTDKLSKYQLDSNITNFKNELLKQWEKLPQYFLTSAKTKKGKDEILNYIWEINKNM
ncbi:MAG: YihA family ribosome biogenesis GTP-binding protein [Bacteroidales bacterium]|nr:YihA family ribosome biogenesis GTP-binding protein [Bacteroidales bacterium]